MSPCGELEQVLGCCPLGWTPRCAGWVSWDTLRGVLGPWLAEWGVKLLGQEVSSPQDCSSTFPVPSASGLREQSPQE